MNFGIEQKKKISPYAPNITDILGEGEDVSSSGFEVPEEISAAAAPKKLPLEIPAEIEALISNPTPEYGQPKPEKSFGDKLMPWVNFIESLGATYSSLRGNPNTMQQVMARRQNEQNRELLQQKMVREDAQTKYERERQKRLDAEAARANQAKIYGESEEGGVLSDGTKIPGAKRKLELGEEVKIDADARATRKAIESAKASAKELGLAEGTPEYVATIRQALKLPEMMDGGIIDRKLAGQKISTDKALAAILAREKNQTQITVADTRAGAVQQKPPTGQERDEMKFYLRMRGAMETLKKLDAKIAKMGSMGQARMVLTDNDWLNFLNTPDGQLYQNALKRLTEARLRADSGAAVPASEYATDARVYGIRFGDKPEVIRQKRASRGQLLDSNAMSSGRAYAEYFGEEYSPGSHIIEYIDDGEEKKSSEKKPLTPNAKRVR